MLNQEVIINSVMRADRQKPVRIFKGSIIDLTRGAGNRTSFFMKIMVAAKSRDAVKKRAKIVELRDSVVRQASRTHISFTHKERPSLNKSAVLMRSIYGKIKEAIYGRRKSK